MPMPLISKAQVYAHDPNGQALYVILTSSIQSPVKILYGHNGPADGLRISQKPMPGLGTWCIVAFPSGDIRNGIFLRSYFPSLIDAVHTTGGNAADPTDPFIDYDAHFSGYWRLMDGHGNLAFQFPDGSYGVFGSGTTLPVVYRHTVSNNQQTSQPFTFSERVPNPPATFQGFFQQIGGTSFELDATGSVTVSGAAGSSITLKANGATIQIETDGNILITPASYVTVSGDMRVLGSVTGGYGGSLSVGLQTHTHPDPQGGNTGAPNAGT